MTSFYAVFEHTTRGNGWYDLADAMGSRIFKSERGADAYSAKLTADKGKLYVVRDTPYIRQMGGLVVSNAGRISMTIPCTCRQAHIDIDPACPYHSNPNGYAQGVRLGRLLQNRRIRLRVLGYVLPHARRCERSGGIIRG